MKADNFNISHVHELEQKLSRLDNAGDDVEDEENEEAEEADTPGDALSQNEPQENTPSAVMHGGGLRYSTLNLNVLPSTY